MSGRLKRVCVFCGAADGRLGVYREAAWTLGRALGLRGLGLVYGGGRGGLMGAVADGTLAAGGEAVGIVPRELSGKYISPHDGLTRIHFVETMHERKQLMHELADGFIALPGGLGTLEELFESLTWAQLGFHAKPCGLLDVSGYFAPLMAFLDHAVAEGLLSAVDRHLLVRDETAEGLLDQMDQRAAR